ncbi:MAG: hypothetical protein WDA68_12860, partial [Phycisphaerae bacterium]
MIDKEKLDKLLNAYIDGELDLREQTEVKRLVKHDAKIASRLKQLEKCRQLVTSIPHEQAPNEILENIRRKIGDAQPETLQTEEYNQEEGTKQLLMRKVLAAAAMILLAAVLGGVIFNIISPDETATSPLAMKPIPQIQDTAEPVLTAMKNTESSSPVAAEPVRIEDFFAATLELNTHNHRAVQAFIQRAIADNPQLIQLPSFEASRNGNYVITGTKEGLSVFMEDLASAWNQFGSAWLYVDTEKQGPKILVSNITPQQINKMAAQPNQESITAMAEDFAVLNRLSLKLVDRDLIASEPD